MREAVDFLRYYAAEAASVEAGTEARGVIACISPWNFPLAIFTGQIAAALVTGNAIIAKQFHGQLPKAFKAELLQLALYALATYPLAYAPITKMVTGKLPSDATFQQEWMSFLDQLGALLVEAKPKAR